MSTPPAQGRRLRAVLFNTTAWEGHHGCTLVCRRIDELAAEAGIDIPLRLNLDPDAASSLSGFDLLIVNGEGTLHHDTARARSLARLGPFAHSIGRPIYLLNSIYEANGPDIAANVAAFDLRYGRDGASVAAMAEAGLRAGQVADLSLSWGPPPTPRRADGGVIVGDSVRRATSDELYALAGRRGARFLSMRAPAPLIPGFPRRNAPRFLLDRLRRASAHLLPPGAKRAAALNRITGFDAFVAALTSAGLVVTGRFHMFTMALALEVPAIAVSSNTSKLEALCADIGLEGRVFPSVAAAEAALLVRGAEGFAYSADELSRLRAFRRRTLDEARAMFAAVAADARAKAS